MTGTPELIDRLVQHATPVRRLRPPSVRAALWLAFATFVLVLLGVGHGMRSDLVARLHEPTFLLSVAAMLATGILSAVAAFAISVPDRPRWLLLLPVPALAVWIATVGYGCLTDWVSMGPEGVRFGETMRCFATLLLTSVPLGMGLALMLRYAALVRTGAVAVMGGLAVAAITSAVLSLLHDLDASVMILVWNLGTAVLITALGRLFGGAMFRWVASRIQAA